jgi:hypothetical protein
MTAQLAKQRTRVKLAEALLASIELGAGGSRRKRLYELQIGVAVKRVADGSIGSPVEMAKW